MLGDNIGHKIWTANGFANRSNKARAGCNSRALLAIAEHAHEMQVMHRPGMHTSYWSCTAAHLAVEALAQTWSCAAKQKPNPQTNTQPRKQAAHLSSFPAQNAAYCHHWARLLAVCKCKRPVPPGLCPRIRPHRPAVVSAPPEPPEAIPSPARVLELEGRLAAVGGGPAAVS